MTTIDKLSYSSKMVNNHPLEKVLISFSSLIIVLFSRGYILPVVVFTAMIVLLLVGAGISAKVLFPLFLIPLVFIGTTLLPFFFTVSRDQQHFTVLFADRGWCKALQLFVKSLSSISCFYFLILSTPLEQLDYLMGKMKISSLFREIMVLLYRFIFLLTDMANQVYISQKQRGGYSSFRLSIRSTAMLCSSLLTRALTHSRQAHLAVRARGGDSDFIYIERDYILRRRNLILISIYIIILILMKWGEFIWLI